MQTQPVEHVSFDKPHEVRQGDNWRLELLDLAGGAQVGRITVQPGRRWSEHVNPVAATDLCEVPHQQYRISGRMHVVMADGSELESGPGDVGACGRPRRQLSSDVGGASARPPLAVAQPDPGAGDRFDDRLLGGVTPTAR